MDCGGSSAGTFGPTCQPCLQEMLTGPQPPGPSGGTNVRADIDLREGGPASRPVIAVIGRPGSGKGTQAARLAAAIGVPHLSTGDVLRRLVDDGSDLADRVRELLAVGALVPDELVAAIVARHVPRPGGGVVLDGFPRTGRQCELLAQLWGPAGVGVAVELEVPVTDVVRRLAHRRSCPACQATITESGPAASRCLRCGTVTATRADDRPEVIQRRLWQHERSIASVRTWYQRHAQLVTVDGCGAPDEVAARVFDALAERHPDTRLLEVG